MSRPQFIIMAGPPAAGKTTSAPLLARALNLPLFGLDDIKERLADEIGQDALQYPDALGDAAVYQLVSIASELLNSGKGVMIEGFIRHGRYESHLLPLIKRSDAILVHLRADDLVLKDRYESRAIRRERHWIHGDTDRIGTLLPELPAELAAPLDLGILRIFIDTSAGPIDAIAVTNKINEFRCSPDPVDIELETAWSAGES